MAQLITVQQMTNGSFIVKLDHNKVASGRKVLLQVLGLEDLNQTTRQLGNLLFKSNLTVTAS